MFFGFKGSLARPQRATHHSSRMEVYSGRVSPKSLHKSARNRTSRSTEDIIALLWGSPSALGTLQSPPNPCPLPNLPPELLLNILSNMDPVSLVCLMIANHLLHNLLHVEKSSLNRCTNWSIRCRLERDLIANVKPLPQRLTRALYKTCALP